MRIEDGFDEAMEVARRARSRAVWSPPMVDEGLEVSNIHSSPRWVYGQT